MSILPALERVHELSGSLQAAAHHDGLLSDNGQGILQQPGLVLDRRRCCRHVGVCMVYNSNSRSVVFLLPLRASPEVLHWCGIEYTADVGWVPQLAAGNDDPSLASSQHRHKTTSSREDACCLRPSTATTNIHIVRYTCMYEDGWGLYQGSAATNACCCNVWLVLSAPKIRL
jgi:hypothetical protein